MSRSLAAAALAVLICFSTANAQIDVSAVIDKATAESLLGEKVKDPTPRNGDGKDGYYSKCNYYAVDRGKSLLVRVHIPASGTIDPAKELELVTAANGSAKPIEGLGDQAQMFSGGGQDALAPRVLMLYVVKGGAFLTIGLSGFQDDEAALDTAKTVAQKLIEHL